MGGARRRTERGAAVAERLAAARQESLAELLGDWWGPDRSTDLIHLVEELTTELCGSDAERPHVGSRATASSTSAPRGSAIPSQRATTRNSSCSP